MPIPALLCLSAFMTAPVQEQAQKWEYHQIGKTELQLLLPKAPTTVESTKPTFTLEHEGMTMQVTVTKGRCHQTPA